MDLTLLHLKLVLQIKLSEKRSSVHISSQLKQNVDCCGPFLLVFCNI